MRKIKFAKEKYDYTMLLAKILIKYRSRAKFADTLGVTPKTLMNKLEGKTPFKQWEVEQICKLLDIEHDDIQTYFFTKSDTRKET